MSTEIEQALSFVKNKKYNEALMVLKNINKEVAHQTFISLQLEGFCFFQEKRYQLAESALNKAFLKATTTTQKIAILLNLKDLALTLNDKKKACQWLEKLTAIDEPSNFVNYAMPICTISFDGGDFDKVIEYANKLLTITAQNIDLSAAVLLTTAYANKGDSKNLDLYFHQVLARIDMLTPELIVFLLNSLNATDKTEFVAEILNCLEKKHSNQPWFIDQKKYFKQKHFSEKAETKNTQKLYSDNPLTLVEGENQKVIDLTTQLIDKLSSMGALFHKDLRFYEEGGNLSIRSYSESNLPEHQIQIPLQCMPLLCDFEFSLIENKTLVVKPKNKVVNINAITIMRLMVDIYNVTNKISLWDNTYPLLTLKLHPSLINSLFKHRPQGNKLLAFKHLFDNGNWNRLLIDSFIGSREFTYRKESLASVNIHTKNTTEKGLLSIIDFLNHQIGSSGYMIDDTESKMNIVTSSCNDNKELYVQYGFMDPISTYLIYGFVDMSSPILFSGAVQLKTLTGLSLIVMSMSGRLKSTIKLSKEYEHLKNYFPAGIQRDQNNIMVSDLIIPNYEFKDTLPQILKAILIKCDKEEYYKDTTLLLNEIKNIEKQLVASNLHYWDLYEKQVVKAANVDKEFNDNTKSDLLNLCFFCKNHLLKYQDYQKL